MKSFMASPSTIEREWYVVDATGHTLGRLASEIATILRGKNRITDFLKIYLRKGDKYYGITVYTIR